MRKISFGKHALRGGLATVATLLFASEAALAQRIFYIDHAGGNDAADGRSEAGAWKHSPGDSRATGNAKALNKKMQPGDVLRFKGGVRYTGNIAPVGSGSAELPILIDGSGWGANRAIMDGGNALAGVRRCGSAADCLGNPNWKSLWRADVGADADWANWLFVDDRPLMPAQYPAVSTPTDFDDIDYFLNIPKAEAAKLKAGVITQPLPAGLDAGAPVVALWTYGNTISYANGARITTSGVDLAGVTFTIGSLNPYPTRDNRFAILNAPMMVNRPGLFAMSPRHKVVIFWPHAGAAAATAVKGSALSSGALRPAQQSFSRVVVGGARRGMNISGLKHAVVRGFSFSNFSRGSPVYSSIAFEHVELSDNIFRSVANMANRQGIISVLLAKNVKILRNQLSEAPGTPGIMVDLSQGPISVSCNRLTDLGRTGIRLINVKGVTVQGNYLARVKGAHGNGISAYRDIRDTVITDNVVVDTARPLTVLGYNDAYFTEGRPQWKVTNNVFINSDPDSAAVSSWGKTRNMELSGNFIGSPKQSVKLTATDEGLVVRNNILVGSVVQPSGMKLVDGTNPVHDPDGNGAAMIDARESAEVRPGVCS